MNGEGLMELSEEARSLLEQSERKRGYTLEMHRIMAAADFAPMGALAFRRGLQAWAAETGIDPG